ncbi:MAG: HIRAN domain-containing protein [Verrucomicrobia bacterium]|nr:HIRAN domain-containing protein [Verrucomicrobiota bacterium]
MTHDLVPIDPALLALMHNAFGKDGALQPFAREIMLIECPIAGTSHRDLKSVEPSLAPGAFLVLKREPANPHDALAIMIFDEAGHHLGYVPRAKNEALAHLLDAGKLLFGKLEAKQWIGNWLKVEARLYLRDF